MKAKILIVGGGAMGTCTAMHAAGRTDPMREPVVLIEKSTLGAGSSGRSGAIVHQAYWDRLMAGMARDALKVYSGIQGATGRSVGYRKTGVLGILDAPDVEARRRFDELLEMKRSIGINSVRLEADGIRSLVPGIAVSDAAIANLEPDGGFIDARRTIHTFATLARNRGAITRTGVSEPEVMIEGGRAIGVRTSDGDYLAPNVVLATGPWTPMLLARLGVQLPLRVVRTSEVFFEMPPMDGAIGEDEFSEGGSEFETRFFRDPLELMPVPHPVIIDHTLGLHVRCEPHEGRTRVGRIGFDEKDRVEQPESEDEVVNPTFVRECRALLEQRLPRYKDMADRGGTKAWITLTPDDRPLVGPVPGIEGLWVCVGFTGNDFHLAPSIGEGLAQMMLGQPVSAFDPAHFAPNRFA